MNFNDQEDCSIYIEELTSDDQNLRINAVQKLTNIAQILGPQRVRDELIPYLIDIIEEKDNEDEFLIKMSQQIVQITDYVGGPNHVHILINPLQILASAEEPTVREKAVNSLIEIAKKQNQSKIRPNQNQMSYKFHFFIAFFSNHFLKMVSQLCSWDNYPSRMSACTLYCAIYTQINQQEKKQMIQQFQQLCRDDTPMVRRTAAHNLESLCKDADSQTALKSLLPLWSVLIQDEIDSVKVRAIESAASLLKSLPQDQVEKGVIAPLKAAIAEKCSWRVRYAISQTIGKTVTDIDQNVVKKEIIKLYEDLLKDTEHQVKAITVSNMPQLCECIPEATIIQTIIPMFTPISTDTSQHVRNSLAEVVCRIAQFLDTQNAINLPVPLIETLMKDEVLEVRLTLMNNVSILNAVLGLDNIQQHIIPILQNIKSEQQWRIRLSFVDFLPKFLKALGIELFKEYFNENIQIFFLDHYSVVREQNFENFKEYISMTSYARFKDTLYTAFKQLIVNPNYIFRIAAIQGLSRLKTSLPKQDLNEIFLLFLDQLGKERVPNVNINLFKCFIEVESLLETPVQTKLRAYANGLKNDADYDVSYFAEKVL